MIESDSPQALTAPKAELERMLVEMGGNVRSLARHLGVARSTTYRWLQAVEIDPERYRSEDR